MTVDRFTVRDMIQMLEQEDQNKALVVDIATPKISADTDIDEHPVAGIRRVNGTNRIHIITHESHATIG